METTSIKLSNESTAAISTPTTTPTTNTNSTTSAAEVPSNRVLVVSATNRNLN
jgi:hypothetical protein